MPSKNRKYTVTSTSAPTQGHAGARKNTVEVIADSSDEFEHLTVKEEDKYVQTYFSSLIL
jgi:hypothetical protein